MRPYHPPDARPYNPHRMGPETSADAGSPARRSIETIEGINPRRAREFASLGVTKLGDLLEYFPRNYQFERREQPISRLVPDAIQIARGQIVAVDYIASRPRPRFEATLDDGTGKLSLVWFHGAWLRRLLHPGQVIRVQGKVQFFRNIPQMVQPKWENIEPEAELVGEDRLRAVYPATAKLSSLQIGQTIDAHLDALLDSVQEWFAADLLQRRSLMGRKQAFRAIHQPTTWEEAAEARRRLVYDELMLMQLGLGIGKRLRTGRATAPAMRIDRLLDERIRRRFPFVLTAAQEKAVREICTDIRSPHPMSRLLQGDVGSGKTVVALYAMLVAVANKLQAAILAPTEVLAEQHYLTLSTLLKDSAVSIELYSSRTKRQSRKVLEQALANGKVHIAIGTQALIQQDIEFANLGLVVVDEQHKLGVRQRAVLKSKGLAPHYLVMTATPIPRTLALSYFADFDVSVIDAPPPGRRPIRTRWLRAAQAEQALTFVREQVAAGRQAYIVVPQIEEEGTEDVKSLKNEYKRLKGGPLARLRLAMLHGQMPAEEKGQVMAAFREHRFDALVATTVIEVGIDVPNATVIVIENAERFGLSQLHQLRGRVGRGSEQSHCILVGDAPTEEARQRLTAMVRCNDGFEIAEMDLKLRGPGDFFGVRQHGLPQFKLADITREMELLQQARQDALSLLSADPMLSEKANRPLREALIAHFGASLPLAQVG